MEAGAAIWPLQQKHNDQIRGPTNEQDFSAVKNSFIAFCCQTTCSLCSHIPAVTANRGSPEQAAVFVSTARAQLL